jgi:hypothetical protein
MHSARPWPLRFTSLGNRLNAWLEESAALEWIDPQRAEVRGLLRRNGAIGRAELNKTLLRDARPRAVWRAQYRRGRATMTMLTTGRVAGVASPLTVAHIKETASHE